MNLKINKKNLSLCLILLMSISTNAFEISLDEAIKTACEESGRGAIISGDLEVAEQTYNAERINFYVPEISITGNLPMYNVSESFSYTYGQPDKSLVKRTNLNFNADINLKQSLITGGEFLVKSQLVNNKTKQPQYNSQLDILNDVTQKSKQGVFNFSLTQPLLKPSEPKNKLRNTKDDLGIARIAQIDELTALKEEVINAYFGVLQTQFKYDITKNKLESAKLKNGIDSIKFSEEILSEEQWLESSSARLDSELDMFDSENDRIEKKRALALLLDYDVKEDIEITIPVVNEPLNAQKKSFYIDNWQNSNPIKKAAYEYAKADRQADFTSSSHGLSGMLTANYTIGRGEYKEEGVVEDNNTDSWGLSVNFTLPLWDGGSKGAQIKAVRLAAKKSELEMERVKKSQKAIIINLINQIDINIRKIEVLNKQIGFANNKKSIAEYRFKDGQISRLEFIESEIYYLEAQDKYFEELKEYFVNKNKLEGKYIL